MVTTTDGHLLGGRVSYRQPATGFRSGIEPVLLAATIPVRAGEHVLEAGTGAGAGLLCLSARVPGVRATGVEIDPALAELATANAVANGFSNIAVITDRIETASLPRGFDHAMANPPYHLAGGSASPDAARETAKRGSEVLIRDWIGRLGDVLRARGSLTLIVPGGMVPACLAAMTASRCPCMAIFPLWPKAERPAKLVILRGVKDARMPMRLMPGLVLHQPDGAFSDHARAILEAATALPIDR
ncbi:MAG TPA: methyltransferase [Rhodopila sp.]|jgi:tRNA1(Val) A37 N6-methylase TrmN6|nr:methyltransferase [Rhodopila sp.]